MKEVRDVVITSAVRTPTGSYNGALASFTAPQLGSKVIKEASNRSMINLL